VVGVGEPRRRANQLQIMAGPPAVVMDRGAMDRDGRGRDGSRPYERGEGARRGAIHRARTKMNRARRRG
jgi:hypothetical protein